MGDDIAIRAEHVSKDFVLPHEKLTSVKSAFTGLYKRRRKSQETQHALRDINFEVKQGEFFGIVGRNGSGKSTMLKILAGIYRPTGGKVTTVGKLVPFIELGVGFNPELTGRENVYLNGAMLGFSRKEIDTMYNDIVDFAELQKFMDQKLKNYSSGMQVRLAFSMATRSEADILLVDEVLAVGDADFQRKCFDYFRELKKKKKTVVFVSHDMGAVREYCERAILIENSRLIKAGSANSIADEYIRLFIPKDTGKNESREPNRAGNQKVEFTEVNVPKSITATQRDIKISITCKVNQAIDNLKIGFKLKDPIDRPLLGINNELAKVPIEVPSKGQSVTVSFSFDNLLNEGSYGLDVVAEGKDGEIYDWWVNSRVIKVFKEKQTGYPIEPRIHVELGKANS